MKKKITVFFMYFLMIFTVIISVFPILWVIMSSFKTNAQILGNPFTLPTSISFEPYIYLFEKYDFLRYAVNSFLVCITSTLLSLLFFAMGAYVIGKYRFPGKSLIFALFTITLLVPSHSKAQPIFSLIMKINLYDNIWGLAVVYLSMGLAMSVFILKSTFMSIPSSLDEAARLEGAGFLRVFFQINLPLAKGGLATAGILMFLNNWNEFFYASLLTSSNKNRTLPVALQFFTESFSYDYTKLFAALTLVVLPGIILYALAQEQVQASVAASGVKG
ncbi:carbohydrate ABC transporter permease [Lacrimispora celerecrescens]|uniref:Raffinose/stachyose/melibiose transport system permease protein n=1 Tax=[Clostridium] celerecrescens 18A TaxID=1286362 RepID=A0A2M8Z7T4_9FIRM|nr:carbohydrate ABC transporter permease [Lacrimispora celerecrescens]PJJ29508.1 raffinose/stachyose/melibiose transport system permease protein [[Clostridium] celerecrescens 18A]